MAGFSYNQSLLNNFIATGRIPAREYSIIQSAQTNVSLPERASQALTQYAQASPTFGLIPGEEFEIHFSDTTPIRCKLYCVLLSIYNDVQDEIKRLLELSIIQPSIFKTVQQLH